MAVTPAWYGHGLEHIIEGDVDFDDGNVKVALVDSTYTPDDNGNEYFSEISGEITGDGYTAGGQALGNPTMSYSGGVTTLDGDDTTWSDSTITARTAVVYYDSGTASTSPLLIYQQSDADVSSTSGEFTVAWNASGIGSVNP
ncbi:MAG: hypothetical protein ACRDMV_03830 [Streptosporangiales bacterium]